VVIIEGYLGWANGDRAPNPSSFDFYGPGGRWGSRPARNGTTRGDHIADALADAGLTEGASLIVVALSRGAGAQGVERLAAVAAAVRVAVDRTSFPGHSEP